MNGGRIENGQWIRSATINKLIFIYIENGIFLEGTSG